MLDGDRTRTYGSECASHAHASGCDGAGGEGVCPSPEDEKSSCWSCGIKWTCPKLYCHGCNSAQPLVRGQDGVDYYDIMELDPAVGFDLDVDALDAKYKGLQRQLHPDRHARSGSLALKYSGAASSVVNEAYNVLRDPLSRAVYLLRRNGVSVGEDFEGTISDPMLLMEIMEAREEIEDADSEAQLRTLRERHNSTRDQLVAEMSAAFEAQCQDRAVAAVNHLTYVARILEEINTRLPSI